MRRKPIAETIQIAVERIECILEILRNHRRRISDANCRNDDIFVNIHAAAVEMDDFQNYNILLSQKKTMNTIR